MSTENSRMSDPSEACSHPDHLGSEKLDKLSEYSSGVDSGFLSGPCTTESDLSSQLSTFDLMSSSSSVPSSSCPHHHHHKPSASISSITTCRSSKSSGYSRLDSGVDVSVSESLSGLNISEHEECSDQLVLDDPKGQAQQPKEVMPSWEYFFSPDEDGDTQLHIGIMEGNEPFVCSLISLVPHPSILDFQNDLSQTALHVAVLCGQPRIVRRLVAAGARVDMRDHRGNTPLHLAANSGDVVAVQGLTMALTSAELQECGLRYPAFAQPLPQQLDLTNYDGQGPIHLAAVGGHCDVIRALHWLGTDLNAKEGKGGRTALHYTVERGHVGALRVLVSECGAELEAENYAGLTAYQLAAGDNSPASSTLTKELSQHGAIPHDLPMDEDDSESSEDEEDNNNREHFNSFPIQS